ncbi:MAG: hypothetical protein GY928_39555 [Colwellia sp.]|nr:hypothetical protein [Colwellia sp.]
MSEDKVMRKFKLVDREGYFGVNSNNESIAHDLLVEGVFTGYVSYGELYCPNDIHNRPVISTNEFKHFEEVTKVSQTLATCAEETSPTYWDGKNTDDIEVGMFVCYKEGKAPIRVRLSQPESNQVVLELEGEIFIKPLSELTSGLPTARELAFTRFLSAHQSRGLDFAHDDAGSRTTLGQAFDVFWKEFLEEK